MTDTVDLDAYFARIGYAGSRTPTLETLTEINHRHACAIPFENLNALLGLPVLLDLDSLQQKMVQSGRGGWCFEQNILLGSVLRALGFGVTWLGARVLWVAGEEAVTPRTHMALQVAVGEKIYLVDVGFGGMSLTTPLLLKRDVEQQTPQGAFRLQTAGDNLTLKCLVSSEWKALYRFGLEEQTLPDYEICNWYLANHPNSPFVSGLMAARADDGCRYTLFNTDFGIHYADAPSERRKLGSMAELRTALTDAMHITLPDAANLDHALQGIVSRTENQP